MADVKVKVYGGSGRSLSQIIEDLTQAGIDFEQPDPKYILVSRDIKAHAPVMTKEAIKERKRQAKQKIWQL